MKIFTIIGGGATGTLLAVNLIKHSGHQPIKINLVEKQERFGRGVAYSTATDFHLLNVPANKMGAFPDDVEHFYKWLTSNGYDFFSNDFVPRRIYGEYLRSLFNETVENANGNVVVNLINDEAVDISINENQANVLLKSGENLVSDKIILAFGNFLPPHLKSKEKDFLSAEKYFQNPWDAEITSKIKATDDILIVGMGLTTVDTILSLYHAQHTGKIYSISTHGWFPAVHELGFVYPNFSDELKDKKSVYELLKIIRQHTKNAESQKSNWRAVIDSLRPATQGIWRELSKTEKLRFMRHLRRVWDISRHRMPKECADLLEELKDKNQLNIIKGRVNNIHQTETGKFEITYMKKGLENKLSVDSVINCTGSESDFAKLDFPLVKNLIGKEYIKTDNLSLGLDAQPNGKISDEIYTIGTSLKGILWESTAMPEIRTQANQLALHLINDLSETA